MQRVARSPYQRSYYIKPMRGDSHGNTKQGSLHTPVALRVLLVEDNEVLAEVTAEFLRSEGLEVRVASTGGEALNSLVAFRPDIVLCDLRLPDMEGFDLARAVRNSSVVRNALFLIHTAFRETDIAAGKGGEVDLFLTKPITPEKLERVLELSRRPRIETRFGAKEKK